jgi:hypothetical protein
MIVLRDPSMIDGISDLDIRNRIEERLAAMCDGEPFDPDLHGFMIVVSPGDEAAELEAESGCPVLHNNWDDTHFGDPDFSPSFEVLEEHDGCYELVFVPGDGDFGVVIFIPKVVGIDPDLLAFCAQYASRVHD